MKKALPLLQDALALCDLYAVVHHGSTNDGGHDMAYCHMGGGAWSCFNDSVVTPVLASQVVSPAAYVLFYKRQQLTGNGIGKTSMLL